MFDRVSLTAKVPPVPDMPMQNATRLLLVRLELKGQVRVVCDMPEHTALCSIAGVMQPPGVIGPVVTFAELFLSVHWLGSWPTVASPTPSQPLNCQPVGTPFDPTPFSKLGLSMMFVAVDGVACTVSAL